MRSVDKAMLLAEYFSLDVSKGVSSFIDWIKESDTYRVFIERMHSFRKTYSLKGKKLYEYGKEIRFKKSFTMEEAVIMYGKMLHFINLSDDKAYINPLIVDLSSSNKIILGDIKIDFDGKVLSLNEVSLLEGYSFDFKKEYVKKAIEEWMKEVNEYIVIPQKKLEEKKDVFRIRNIFTFSRIIQIVIVSLMLAFMFVIRFSNIEFLNKIYTNEYGNILGFIYYLMFSYTGIYFVELMIICIYFSFKLGEYRKNLKALKINIDGKVVDEKNKLEYYILKQFTSNNTLEAKVNSFNSLSKLNAPLYYFAKRSAQNKKIMDDKMTEAELISFSIYTVLAIVFFIIFVISIGGA